MQEQERVARFVAEHDMDADPAYRVLDLAAEVGEVAADAAKSAEYGASPDELAVSEDELGDALFALLATADALDVDAGAALDTSLAKYERRLTETGGAGSGTGPDRADGESAATDADATGPGASDPGE